MDYRRGLNAACTSLTNIGVIGLLIRPPSRISQLGEFSEWWLVRYQGLHLLRIPLDMREPERSDNSGSITRSVPAHPPRPTR